MNLTPQGSQMINELAARYYVSTDAVLTLLQAVMNGGGTMAQFNHPELGGSGQWMQGGMTMVGDMFNNALKNKVDGLCSELAGFSANPSFFAPPAQMPPAPASGNASLFVANSGGSWWPGDLGTPSSSGSQNNVRYAVFPYSHRLAIEINGQTTVYDTLNHQIGGVGQQQGGDTTLTFTSQFGTVSVGSLPIVSGQDAAPFQSSSPPEMPVTDAESDIFAKIERLADLRQKGILSEQEFASKKSELMSRL